MINLDELIYSYRYVKGMIERVERELDDNYDNLSTLEIHNKESDLNGLNKTMGELYKKISVIRKNAIKADLVKATITTNQIDTFIFDKSIRHDNNIVELKNRVIGRFTFNINGNEVVREGEYLLSFNDDYIESGKVFISIKTAQKVDDNITSFTSAMVRILRKYEKNEIIEGEKCPECSGKLIRENGCIHCIDCGWSRCE